MALFAIQAVRARGHFGFSVIEQVPTFILNGDTHGLLTRVDAERFANNMLRDLIDPNDGLSVNAEEI